MAYRPPHRRNLRADSLAGPAAGAPASGASKQDSGSAASNRRNTPSALHHSSRPLSSGHDVRVPQSQSPLGSHLPERPASSRTGEPGKHQGQGRHGPAAQSGQGADNSEAPARGSSTGSAGRGEDNRFRRIPSQSNSSSRHVPDLTDRTDIQLTEVTTRGSQGHPTSVDFRSEPSRTAQMGPAGQVRRFGSAPQKYHPTSSSPSRLESPSSDLKPTTRTFTPIPNEMELLASVSRSGGTEEGDALKCYDTQERLRGYIDEKIHRYHSSPDDSVDCLKNIVLLFRKLREGVIASGRLDEFTIELFEESVRYAILARDQGQLLSALNGLVPELYMKVDEKVKKEGVSPNDIPHVVRHIRSLSLCNGNGGKDNREYFSSLLLIYHLVHSTREVYQHTLEELTLPRIPLLRPHPAPVAPPTDAPAAAIQPARQSQTPPPSESSPFVSVKSQSFARAAADALATERLDPIAFHRLVSGEFCNGKEQQPEALERLLLSWAAPRVRELAVPMFKKCYMSASIEWAALILGLEKKGVEMWALANGFSIRDGILKLR